MNDSPINTFKTLDAVFGTTPTPIHPIVPLKEETTNLPSVVTSSSDFPATSELADDYQKARLSLRNLLEKSEHALDNMLQIAVQTESARSFEVASAMIKTTSELAKDLVALHEATNKAKKKTDDTPSTGVTHNTQNNVVFQGSTTDLFNMMSGK